MISNHKKNAKFNGLRVEPFEFEKQMKYLIKNNWTFFTMSELVEKKDELPARSIAITFDDGYEDNFTNAFPLLKKYNIKATIYLVVDRHNKEWSSKRKEKNNTGELKNEPKLLDEQIHELISSGLIEIGSHTMNHDNLPNLNVDDKRNEIYNSKLIIEEKFKIKCNSFCYPFGLYDKEDIQTVKDSSYTNATTTKKGIDNLAKSNIFELRRITISGKDNILAFKIKLKRGLRGLRK
jgi:peptidoglycan/xylan/chitin deacetylase (PgdA/CDA1 family)